MNTLHKFSLLSLALLSASSALGQSDKSDARPPLQKFIGDSKFEHVRCGLMLKLWIAEHRAPNTPDPEHEPGKCVDAAKANILPLYKGSVARYTKNSAAVSATKDYYAYWLTAMDGIFPSADERTISYEQRQSQIVDKLNELANRLTIEAE